MRVRFEQVDSPDKEEALIRAQAQTEDIKAAIDLLEGNERKIPLLKDGNNVFVETSAIYYIESVDKKSFVYSRTNSMRQGSGSMSSKSLSAPISRASRSP